jgi:hypothetical protein
MRASRALGRRRRLMISIGILSTISPAVPALGDMMGRVGKDDAGEPSHGRCWRRKAIVSIGILSP